MRLFDSRIEIRHHIWRRISLPQATGTAGDGQCCASYQILRLGGPMLALRALTDSRGVRLGPHSHEQCDVL